MPIVNVGKSNALSTDQLDALNNLRDSDGELVWEVVVVDGKEEVHTHLTTQGGLSSFKLGGKHIMASGAENIFWTNLGSGTHWFPAWQGIKDQSVSANQDASGIYMPTARVYSRLMGTINTGDIPEATPISYIPYINTMNFPDAVSGFGVSIRSGLVLGVGDILIFGATNVGTGIAVFNSDVVIPSNVAVGEVFDVWFDKPTEILDNTDVSISVEVKRGVGGSVETMLVSEDTLGKPFDVGMVRTFRDLPIGLSHIEYVADNDDVYYNTTFAVDTNVGSVTLTVDPLSMVSNFTVFDANKSFSVANPCTVSFGLTQGDAVLQTRNDSYKFYRNGTVWHYLDSNTNSGGIV